MWLAIFCKLSDEFSIIDFSRKFNKNASKNHPGGSPEAPRTMPERFLTHSANSLRILSPKRAAHKVIWGQIWDPLGPAGDPKMLKNRADEIFQASREGPGAVPNRIFDRRGCETRSNSIFGRFLDPSNPYETLRMAANLKVFRFADRGSKKTQNGGPGDPIFEFFRFFFFFGPSGRPKIPNWRFLRFSSAFFLQENLQCEKKRKKKRNDGQDRAMRGAGGRGGRVALACITLRVFAGVGAGVCMQAFVRHLARRWGAADSNAARIPPSQLWWLGCLEG